MISESTLALVTSKYNVDINILNNIIRHDMFNNFFIISIILIIMLAFYFTLKKGKKFYNR